MNVLAINSSPKMEKSNTSVILNPFIDGLKEAGANVELFYTKKLNIKPCEGEFNCWFKNPGKCFINDDMQMLYPKLKNADILIFATPVYVDGVTASLKLFMDRICPLGEPFFEIKDDHCRHVQREGTKQGKFVLISNCGFWELDNFDPMVTHMRAFCKNVYRDFSAALLRPHGGGLKYMSEAGNSVDDIIKAAKRAGFQLAKNGEIPSNALETISRPLMSRDDFIKGSNHYFKGLVKTSV